MGSECCGLVEVSHPPFDLRGLPATEYNILCNGIIGRVCFSLAVSCAKNVFRINEVPPSDIVLFDGLLHLFSHVTVRMANFLVLDLLGPEAKFESQMSQVVPVSLPENHRTQRECRKAYYPATAHSRRSRFAYPRLSRSLMESM